ncbi:MAG TPA: hypothetical protein VF230_05710 [Acidimicrobiales bacterium]
MRRALRLLRLLSATTIVGSSIVMYLVAFAAPASAQSGCSATFNGVNVATYNTPKRALRVREGQKLNVTGTALPTFYIPGEDRDLAYHVKLELAGASWTATSGVSDKESWAGTVNVSDYANRGQGIYKVVAVTQSNAGTECFARAYVNVKGGGALSTTAGQIAAGVGVLGAAGAATAGARGGREIDEGAVKDAVGDFLEEQAGPPPETPASVDETAARTEMMGRHGAELHLMTFCLPLVIVAAVATIRAIASDVTHHITASIGGMFR